MSNTSNPASKQAVELTGQLEKLLKTIQALSLLEKDLLKEKLRKIYSLVDSLATIDEAPTGKLSEQATADNQGLAQAGQEESIRSQVMATLFSNKSRTGSEAENKTESPTVNYTGLHHDAGTNDRNPASASVEVEFAATDANMSTSAEKQHKKTDNTVAEPGTLGTQYKATETVADKIGKSESGGVRLEEKLKHQPLEDLRQSIGINERFLFTNNFFGGNQQEYLQFIDRINTLHDFEEAIAFARDTIHPNTSTPGNAEAMEHFEELLRRRFKP